MKLVGNGPPTVHPTKIALKMAEEQGLNLVEMSDKTDPPICKIFDYKKFKYEQDKKAKQIKGNKIVVKEVQFTLRTDEHDFAVKINHIIRFLQDGATVKGQIRLRGREPYIAQKRARDLIKTIIETVAEHGSDKTPPAKPKAEGKVERRLFFFIEPNKK